MTIFNNSLFRIFSIMCGAIFIYYLSTNTLLADVPNTQMILGKQAPSFHLFDLFKKQHNLQQWRGKTIIINFWATWCGPCKKEIPLLNKFQKRYQADNFQIVGIAIDNSLSVKKFVQHTPIDYPNLLGGRFGSKLAKQYGNYAGGLPYTVIINSKGKIVEVANGMLNEQYLQRSIEKYL